MSGDDFIFSEFDALARFEVTAQVTAPFDYRIVRLVPRIKKTVVSFCEESCLVLFFEDGKIVGPLVAPIRKDECREPC